MRILVRIIPALILATALSTADTADAAAVHRCTHPRGHAYGWIKQHHCYTTPENEPGIRRDFPTTIVTL